MIHYSDLNKTFILGESKKIFSAENTQLINEANLSSVSKSIYYWVYFSRIFIILYRVVAK